MKLRFVIDKNYDAILFSKLKDLGFNFIPLKKTLLSNKNFIKKLVNIRYTRVIPYLDLTRILYQKSWDAINSQFFKTTEEITGYPWKYPAYFCVLSLFRKGISNWGGNKIVRSWKENPYTMRKITAHELLISHLFTIFEKDFQKDNLSNKEKWALAEISAWLITGLEKKMLKFWPWITEEEKYPVTHNYPELYKLQKTLKPEYEKRKDFKEFLRKSIEITRSKNI